MPEVPYRPEDDVAALIAAAAGSPSLRARGVTGARAYLAETAAAAPPGPDFALVDDHHLDGPVTMRVYRPAGKGPFPVVTYFHGGGWVIGSIETSDAFARRLAAATPCVVVSVDYRLAPEHPWPTAVGDAVAAIRWTARHAVEIDADPARHVVLGDSAGGNLATVAIRLTLADPAVAVARQVLAYPTIRTTQDRASHAAYGAGWPLANEDLAWFVECYVADPADRDDPDVTPLAADVGGMPPTSLVLAGCDPLHDEGIEYADHLAAAGVAVDVHVFGGQIHGFVTFPPGTLARGAEALGVVTNAIRNS